MEVLFEGLTPVYAVSGNHENNTKLNQTRMDALYQEYGVNFLKNSGTTIAKDGANIFVYGLDDRKTIINTVPVVDEDTYGI